MSTCPVHGTPFNLIPAGVSKTSGAPYPAFWACGTRGCKLKPAEGLPAPPTASAPVQTTPAPQSPPRPASASERTLLLFACLDFASRVFQGTSDEQTARAVAYDLYTKLKGELS